MKKEFVAKWAWVKMVELIGGNIISFLNGFLQMTDGDLMEYRMRDYEPEYEVEEWEEWSVEY